MGGWGSGQSPVPPETDPCSTRQTEPNSECPAVSPAVEKHTIYVRGIRYSQDARQERGLGRGLGGEGTGSEGEDNGRGSGGGGGRYGKESWGVVRARGQRMGGFGRRWRAALNCFHKKAGGGKDRCVRVGNYDKRARTPSTLVLHG